MGSRHGGGRTQWHGAVSRLVPGLRTSAPALLLSPGRPLHWGPQEPGAPRPLHSLYFFVHSWPSPPAGVPRPLPQSEDGAGAPSCEVVVLAGKLGGHAVSRFEEEESWRSQGWRSEYEVRLWPLDNTTRRWAGGLRTEGGRVLQWQGPPQPDGARDRATAGGEDRAGARGGVLGGGGDQAGARPC